MIISMWAYNLVVKNIVRSKYIFVENNKVEILLLYYIIYINFIIFHKDVLASNRTSYLLLKFI